MSRDIAKFAMDSMYGRQAQVRFRGTFTPYKLLEMYDRIEELEKRLADKGVPEVESTDSLSASEALFGFCRWLSSREQPTTMSYKHNVSRVAKLVERFCEANELSKPGQGWSVRVSSVPKGDVGER